MSTRHWFIQTIPLLLVLNVLFGWHEWSDLTYLGLIFAGMLVALFEGGLLLDRLNQRQSQNTIVLERLDEGQRQNTLLLERLEAEQQKMKRQQVREAIVLEAIVANMPVASHEMPGDDCGTR
jgi:hypothetical protein